MMGEAMDVVRDVLDQPVFDRDGRPMGRADGLLITLENGEPPQLASVLIGPLALAERLSPAIGRWMAALERMLGLPKDRPVSLPFGRIDADGERITADVAASDTSALLIEQRLQRWLAHIPGSKRS
jgi:hypothetical protein